MKLTIEIPDKLLHLAVEDEVGRAIAKMVEPVIQEHLDKILTKKLERISKTLSPQITAQVSSAIFKVMGANRSEQVRFLRDIATGVLSENLKRIL